MLFGENMTVQEIDKIRYDVLGPKVVKALENKYYEAYYCSSVKEGVKKALSLIPQNSIVSWGGSQSCVDSGLIDCVKNGNYKIIDRDSAKTPEERYNLMRDALFSDVYLTSFNAISEDGIIYNIDGNGNRVAAITFGPKSVVALVGMNKICHTSEDAFIRAKQVAAVRNATRFGLKTTGCAVTGNCQNCYSSECICSVIQTLRFCKNKNRIKIILVGEELGF